MEIMDIRGKIWEVKDGVITKLYVEELNQVFVVEQPKIKTLKAYSEEPKKEAEKQIISPKQKVLEDYGLTTTSNVKIADTKETIANVRYDGDGKIFRGHQLGEENGQYINSYVVDNLKSLIKANNFTDESIIQLLKEWHPEAKIGSIRVYKSAYLKYLRKQGLIKPTDTPKPSRIIRVRRDTSDRINELGGIGIYQSVINKIMNGWSKGIPMIDILRKEHPNIREASLKKYLSAYKKHFREKLSVNPDDRESKPTPTLKKKKSKHRRHKRKPHNAIGFDDVYNTWIKQDEYGLVMRALRKYNFKATTKNISKETRLKTGRINAIIHYLVDKNLAYMNYDKETLEPVYYPETGKETRVNYP